MFPQVEPDDKGITKLFVDLIPKHLTSLNNRYEQAARINEFKVTAYHENR